MAALIFFLFKVIYSVALPAQPRSNYVVFRPEKNKGEKTTGIKHNATWKELTSCREKAGFQALL